MDGSGTGVAACPYWPDGPGSEAALSLWRDMNASYLPKDEFIRRAEGLGVDPGPLWGTLTSLRRHASVEMPFPPMLAHDGADVAWLSLPRDSQITLTRIASASFDGSTLGSFLGRKPACVRLLLMVDEIAAAFRRDGFDVTPEDVRASILGGRPGKTGNGLLIQHYLNLLDYNGISPDRTITQELIAWFYEELDRSLDDPPRPCMRRYREPSPGESRRALAFICDLLTDDDYSRYGDPVISWIGATTMFWDTSPLPAYNALVELLVRQIHFRRNGRSLLGAIDFLSQSMKWEEGGQTRLASLPPFEVVVSDDCGDGYDATYYHSEALLIVNDCVRFLNGRISNLMAFEAEARESVQGDARLNLRQRALLDDMIGDATSIMDLGAYEHRFGVAHSTALSDMRELARLGYVGERYEGRKLVYSLDMSALLASTGRQVMTRTDVV